MGSTLSTVLGEYSMNYMGIMSAIRILLSQGKCRRGVIATEYAPGTTYSMRGQMPQGTGQVPQAITIQRARGMRVRQGRGALLWEEANVV